MYQHHSPSGQTGFPGGALHGPTTANPTGGMIRIGSFAVSPWLLVGAALAVYASRKAWRKLK
jgi:hypothetical protein